MKVLKVYEVPTGKIAIINGSCGKPLECLSLGDYGKEHNIKADFLGLHDDIYGVECKETMPLGEKWVVTISTQYGCSMGCRFCDVPKVGPGINATLEDLRDQVDAALGLYPEIGSTKRLNLHYARMGEPTFNRDVIDHARVVRRDIRHRLGRSLVHPVVSTMLPRNNPMLNEFLNEWAIDIKNEMYRGDAGLQLSINSTSDKQREEMFRGNSLTLDAIAAIGDMLPRPIGRKYTLNFALADGYEIDAIKLADMFDPSKFMCKITPIHVTKSSLDNGITTSGGYSEYTPYRHAEDRLKAAGFDVIVFVPSVDEDMGMITCGNAVLSGRVPPNCL